MRRSSNTKDLEKLLIAGTILATAGKNDGITKKILQLSKEYIKLTIHTIDSHNLDSSLIKLNEAAQDECFNPKVDDLNLEPGNTSQSRSARVKEDQIHPMPGFLPISHIRN